MYEELGNGISQAIICSKQIYIYRLTDMRRNTVDLWIEAVQQQIESCVEKQQPLITLNHFDGSDVKQTPYSDARGKEVSEKMPDLEGYTAFVMEKNSHTIEMQIYMQRTLSSETRQRMLFFEFDEALEWLKSKLPKPCSKTL